MLIDKIQALRKYVEVKKTIFGFKIELVAKSNRNFGAFNE